MCASFAPPKPPSAFTVGKAGQESAAGAPRKRQNSTPRRSRSPSPLSQASLNGVGGHAFGKEDFAKALSAAGSLNGGGGGSGGGGSGGGGSGSPGGGYGAYAFTTAEGVPTPLSISHTLKPRGGYSIDDAGPSTAPATAVSSTALLVSPTGDEDPFSVRPSSAGAAATPAGFAADSPTTAAGRAARSFTTGAAASRPVPATPTFSEIAQGAIRAGGDLPLEPFARARVRAAEEEWARREAERQEREKRWQIKTLSCATLLVLAVVLACRCLGVGITINDPAGTAPPARGTNKASKPSGSTAPPQHFLSAAAGEMPAIASSKDEFVAALKLAGLKKPKPQKVDRAWSALVSGENRVASGGRTYNYAKGGALVAKVVVAGVLRNPDFVAVFAAALATAFVLFSLRRRPRRSWGWSAVGSGGGGGGGTAARGGGEATNGSGSTRAAGLLRPGSRGAGGVGAVNGRVGNGVGVKSGVGVGVRGASSLSPRRLVGS